jgi:hypothetical protein
MQQNQQSAIKTHVSFAKTPEPPYYAVIFTSQRIAATKLWRKLVIVPGGPSWFSDSPYLKASVTAGLFCDNALVHWSSLVGGSSAIAGGALPPSGWSPLEYSEDLMPSFGRTRALGAAASAGDTAITAGGTIAAAEASCRALCWGAALCKFPRGSMKIKHLV